jgi:hypothetical protein
VGAAAAAALVVVLNAQALGAIQQAFWPPTTFSQLME